MSRSQSPLPEFEDVNPELPLSNAGKNAYDDDAGSILKSYESLAEEDHKVDPRDSIDDMKKRRDSRSASF